MGQGYLIDTNAISDYLKGVLPLPGKLFLAQLINAIPQLSVINQIELLAWNVDASTSAKLNKLLALGNILPITDEIVTRCVEIRRSRILKMPDAVIAATALANNRTLVTRSMADFERVNGPA